MILPPEGNPIVAIFGASGFVGRHLVRVLTANGYRIRAGCRRPELAGYLTTNGYVGQVELMRASASDEGSLHRMIDGADYVINLVGILFEKGKQRFDFLHNEFVAKISHISLSYGVKRIVSLSSIGANPDSAARYAISKAMGEQALRKICVNNVIIRSSVIFGPEDRFFNKFAKIALMSPFLPLIGGGRTVFQPVYVGDVAQALAKVLQGDSHTGKIYEVGGAEQLSFRQLMLLVLKWTGRKRLLLPIPSSLARFEAFFLELLPTPMLTRDQVILLGYDNIVSPNAIAENRCLADLGITPTAMSTIVPDYLKIYRKSDNSARF